MYGEWIVDRDPEEDDVYLVAWRAVYASGNFPLTWHFYALVTWDEETGWDYSDFPHQYNTVQILAWMKLPPYYKGEELYEEV